MFYPNTHTRCGTTRAQVGGRAAATHSWWKTVAVPSGTMSHRWVESLHPLPLTLYPRVLPQYLLDVQEHLGVKVPETTPSFEVPVDEFDGRVVYGERRRGVGPVCEGHVAQLAPSVAQLAKMESLAQTMFLRMQTRQKWTL